MVLRAGIFMAWSRNVVNSGDTKANQTSTVNLFIDLDHNLDLNIHNYKKIVEQTENELYSMKDDCTTTDGDKQSPAMCKRKKKKKKECEESENNSDQNQDYGKGYIYFPGDGDYTIHKVNLNKPHAAKLNSTATQISFWLYTRQNPTTGEKIRINDLKSVTDSKFNAKKVTIFLSHGYLGYRDTPANIALTEAFLYNSDVNVIRLDWSYFASSLWHPTAAGYAPEIGKMFGKFIVWLHRNFGLSLDKVHLVGFSLGAHVVGNAGRELQGNARRLTALDPAGPGWRGAPECLNKTDARYVEVIHTNGGHLALGHWDPLGHSDHYPNGGFIQPNCSSWRMSKHICSHYRAYELMAATVKLDHLRANTCVGLKHVIADKCTRKIRPMGNADISKYQSGIFRVNTKGGYPF